MTDEKSPQQEEYEQQMKEERQERKHTCVLPKELENKVRVLATEQNSSICQVSQRAVEELVDREQRRRDCQNGILKPDDPACKSS